MSARRISILVDQKGVNKVTKELNKLQTIGNKVVTGLKKIPAALGKIGTKIWSMKGRIALGAVALAGAILYPFAKLETSLARVQVALGDFAGESIPLLESLADQLGRDTLYSASDAAEGMLYLAKAGMDVNEILAATPGVLNAAIVEGLDLATAADVITDALVTMNLEADQAGRVADVLALGSNLAKTNIPEMGAAIAKVGTIARLSGIDLENLVGMFDAVAGYGIRGEEAGTHLRTAMMTFQNIGSGAVTGNAKKAFKDLGIDVDKIAKGIKNKSISFVDFAKMMFESGADAGQFSQVFEKRTAASIIAIGEAASGSNPALAEFVDQLYNAAGYSEAAGAIMEDTLEGQIKQVKSSLQTLTNAIARTIAPALQDYLENDLRPWINDVTALWEEGGTTWQEKLSSVWSEKLRPEIVAWMEGIGDVITGAIPAISEAVMDLGSQIALPLAQGMVKGLWNITKAAGSGWEAFFKWIQLSLRETMETADPLGWGPSSSNVVPPSMAGGAPDLGFIPEYLKLDTSGLPNDPHLGPTIDNANEIVPVLEQIENNTADIGSDDSGGSGSGGWLASLFSGEGLASMAGSFLDPLSQTLLSSVTDPIISSLEEQMGPTSTEIGHLADTVFGFFDVPLSFLDSGIRKLNDFFGGNDFDDGRYTYAGAYASGGTSYAASSAIHTGDINIHGVKDGADAADKVVSEMSGYGEISSRQTSLGLKKGMVSREASEY